MTMTIKELCEQYDIVPAELSYRFGIPLRTAQQWYAGERTPPPYVVNMIKEILETSHQPMPKIRKKPINKTVDQFDLDGKFISQYPSLTAAAKATGVSKQAISDNCKEKTKQCAGYVFRFADSGA